MLSVVNCENKEVILSGDLNCNYLIANDCKEIKKKKTKKHYQN